MALLSVQANNQDSPLIGLTGGIGVGKSTVAAMFADLGLAVVDADQVAKQVLTSDPQVIRAVGERIDASLVDQQGKVDRGGLAQRIFNDPVARKTLEQIMHPVIAKRSSEQIAELRSAGHPGVVYEASLLVETGRHTEMDCLVVVIAEESVRLERLKRRGTNEADARARMAAQLPEQEKVKLADYVVNNSGEFSATRAQVLEVWQKISAGMPA